MANTNTNAFANIFASLDNVLATQDKKIEKAQETRELLKIQREETLLHDTDIYAAFAQSDKVAIISANFGGAFQKTQMWAAKTSDGDKLTSAEASLMAVSTALESIKGAKAGHASVYTNGGEVLRLSGMLNRIKKGSDIVLTEGEKKHIAQYSSQYGAKYAAIAKMVFNGIKEATDAGKVISFHGIDELGYAPLQRRLPADAADSIVTLKRGKGFVTVNGRNYSVVARNGYLTGEFKLVADQFGRIALEDPIDEKKNPAKALAFKLFRVASRDVVLKDSEEQAEAAGLGKEAVAA